MDILNNLIEINTVNDLENAKIREYLKTLLQPLNFEFEEIGNSSTKVLIAKRGESNLGFVCHTDTVSASNWRYNPFTLTNEEDKLYGLGSSDMKGGIAALLEALKDLPKEIPLTCYFTFDEEIDFKGIKLLTKNKKNFPKTLVFPEPTNGIPAIANKGCMEFKVEFMGISAHSSTPLLGENAIIKAMNFTNELNIFAKSLENEKDYLYEVPYTTCNLAKISGGSALNKVPDYCEIAFDFRTINSIQESKILETINDLVKKYKAKLEIINNVSCALSKSLEFKDCIEKICNCKCTNLNYVTEASFFIDKNILILGPGPVTAHQKDEYITKTSFLETINLYKKIIKELSYK